MKQIGLFDNREVLWVDYHDILNSDLSKANWICLLSSSKEEPDLEIFMQFTRLVIGKGVCEFKCQGQQAALLHDFFDELMAFMEAVEGHPYINVVTTGRNNQPLVETFWECYYASTVSTTDNIKVVCSDVDGVNRIDELKSYLDEFRKG